MGSMFSLVALAVLRVCLGLYLIACLTRSGVRLSARCAWVCPAALGVVVFGWPNPAQMGLEAVALALCAARFLRCDGRRSLFIATYYEIALALWLVHGVALFAVLVVCKRRCVSRRQVMKGFAMFFLLSLVSLISLQEQARLAISGETIDLWLMMTLILMIGVLVANLRSQLDTERELATLRAAQAESAEREYQRLSRTYAANARLFHDLHNHLGVLRRLVAQEKTSEAADYLDSLQAPLSALTTQHWTGDETVDHLISAGQQQCEAAGIRFTAMVEFPAHTNLRGADLCAILGNLLDNAREGALQASGERFLRLTMRRIGMTLVIKVENSARAPHADHSTTKTDGGLHGWGLASASAAAARYDGVVQTNYTEGVFTAIATLSFEAI